jgi:hypothetical protein
MLGKNYFVYPFPAIPFYIPQYSTDSTRFGHNLMGKTLNAVGSSGEMLIREIL